MSSFRNNDTQIILRLYLSVFFQKKKISFTENVPNLIKLYTQRFCSTESVEQKHWVQRSIWCFSVRDMWSFRSKCPKSPERDWIGVKGEGYTWKRTYDFLSFRQVCPERGLNSGQKEFQSSALPTEPHRVAPLGAGTGAMICVTVCLICL